MVSLRRLTRSYLTHIFLRVLGVFTRLIHPWKKKTFILVSMEINRIYTEFSLAVVCMSTHSTELFHTGHFVPPTYSWTPGSNRAERQPQGLDGRGLRKVLTTKLFTAAFKPEEGFLKTAFKTRSNRLARPLVPPSCSDV